MTEEQRKLILDIEKEIQSLPGGEDMIVFMSISIVRIQNTKINECYRMATFEPFNTEEQIRSVMMAQFENMRRELSDRKEKE